MKSKKKPQKIVFKNSDANLGMKKTLNKVAFIFKTGDDLRQDSHGPHVVVAYASKN